MKIISISESPKKNKRFRVYLDDNTHYDFGLKHYKDGTYIDHKDKKKRLNYIARHLGNMKEKQLIDSLTPSASLFSMTLLWGKYDNLYDNIEYLNNFLPEA
jgi:hypothetical protein